MHAPLAVVSESTVVQTALPSVRPVHLLRVQPLLIVELHAPLDWQRRVGVEVEE